MRVASTSIVRYQVVLREINAVRIITPTEPYPSRRVGSRQNARTRGGRLQSLRVITTNRLAPSAQFGCYPPVIGMLQSVLTTPGR